MLHCKTEESNRTIPMVSQTVRQNGPLFYDLRLKGMLMPVHVDCAGNQIDYVAFGRSVITACSHWNGLLSPFRDVQSGRFINAEFAKYLSKVFVLLCAHMLPLYHFMKFNEKKITNYFITTTIFFRCMASLYLIIFTAPISYRLLITHFIGFLTRADFGLTISIGLIGFQYSLNSLKPAALPDTIKLVTDVEHERVIKTEKV